MSEKQPTPYEVLGLEPTCSQQEITKAYRKLAQKYHPDKEGGNAEMFDAVSKAYDQIGTKEAREAYDSGGASMTIEEVRNTLRESMVAAIDESALSALLPRLNAFLVAELHKNRNMAKNAKKKRAELQCNAKRITVKDPEIPNLYEQAMEAAIGACDDKIKFHEQNVALLEGMQKELTQYEEGPVVFPEPEPPMRNVQVLPNGWSPGGY